LPLLVAGKTSLYLYPKLLRIPIGMPRGVVRFLHRKLHQE